MTVYRLKLARVNTLKLAVTTRLPAQFEGGTGMTVTKTNGVYTIDMDVDEVASVLQPTLLDRANHTGTQLASTISNFSEATDDRVGSLLVAGSNVTLTYNDVANTLTVASAVDAATLASVAALETRVYDDTDANILDWIPSNLHADIAANISATNVSSYFRQAFSDVGLTRRIYCPCGTYVFTSNVPHITAPSGVFGPGLYLFGDGPGKTIFDNRAGVTAYTNTFATTNLSRVVTVTRTAHGLSATSQLTIHGSSAPVGGLSFDGTWMIESVPTADTFTFNHTSTATSTTSGSVTYGVTNPLFDIDTNQISKFQHFVHLHDFSIINSTSPSASVGIRIRRAYQLMMERVWINGMTKNGVHITIPNSTAGDRDGANMVTMRHVRIENCATWGIDCELRSANTGANEFSFFETDQVFVQGCGTVSAALPPPSGGIRWKGQVWNIKNTAAVINENCGVYVEGASGLANTIVSDSLVLENNKKKGIYITGLSRGDFKNTQIYNNDSYTATAGFEIEGSSFVSRNIDINGAVIRATSGNSAITAFKLSGANADANSCVVRRKSIVWDNFDFSGQTRYSGFGVEGTFFSVNKNTTDQTGVLPATFTKVTFSTAVINDESRFDTVNSRWSPPPGRIRLSASAYISVGAVDQAQALGVIYKNGASYRYLSSVSASGTGAITVGGTMVDIAVAGDYYELFVNVVGAGNKTISGSTQVTYFEGQSF